MAIILLACGPCVVIVNCWDRFCTLGRAPHTKETLPDFCELCWVTRHPRVFRGLKGLSTDPRVLGCHRSNQGYGNFHHKCRMRCQSNWRWLAISFLWGQEFFSPKI